MRKLLFVFSILFFLLNVKANDSTVCIKIHFIYGSKPKREFKEEKKWFGGIHGGHVGIEVDSSKIFDFIRSGKTHVFSKKKNLSGKFLYPLQSFWRFVRSSNN